MDKRPLILRFELEGMAQVVNLMLSERTASIMEEIQAAVDGFCTPENLRRVIDEQVAISIKAAVQGEIANFFQYGAGRDVIKEAVLKQLGKDYS